MQAMRIHRIQEVDGDNPALSLEEIPVPRPGERELLIKVAACGVCRTELDEIEGRTSPSRFPMTPGHQVVGEVIAEGPNCKRQLLGRRVGVAWIHSACGHCPECLRGAENLCPAFRACGRDAHGGYAQFMTIPEPFAAVIPEILDTEITAPLLCAGAVGWRALRHCQLRDGQALGLTGFGASAHIILQMAEKLYPDSPVYVFARSPREQAFAVTLGAAWAGDTADSPPTAPIAIIDTTPAWKPVVCALDQLAAGGRLVINAIRKESGDNQHLLALDYARHLWREKHIMSVANVTRADVIECLEIAASTGVRPHVSTYALTEANEALLQLKRGQIRGAKVLRITPDDDAGTDANSSPSRPGR